ncbi:MAG: class I mannose-6-phosphate isomerase [Kiritimatiellae bacterium]|nr:class I mannose-6-phosphate isomerase [Kiritimatiellia bacterium]MBR6587426.1 class I mannose-6-phosphate isomerase [Kiritimatiellia bacterium]
MERQRHDTLWGFEDWLYDDGVVLIKRICADMRLSVQVHPNDETAKTVGGRAKTEMWCVLKDGPIFAGFKSGVTDADVVRAVEDGSFESLLVRFDAKVGECYFIPGGLVHAIGEGTSVFEVQQSSNTTFRLYDWGRLDANGNPRQLHVQEALAAMDLSLPPPMPGDSVECRYFTFRRVEAGRMSADVHRRVVYDPSTDSLTVVEPSETPELPNPAFEVLLP